MHLDLPQLNCLFDLFDETQSLHLDVERAQMLVLGLCSVWNIAKNAEGSFPHDNDAGGETSLGFLSNKKRKCARLSVHAFTASECDGRVKRIFVLPGKLSTHTHTLLLSRGAVVELSVLRLQKWKNRNELRGASAVPMQRVPIWTERNKDGEIKSYFAKPRSGYIDTHSDIVPGNAQNHLRPCTRVFGLYHKICSFSGNG